MENVFSKKLSVYVSPAILEEYSRVLEQKFKWKKQEIMENIRFLAGVFNTVEPSKKCSVIKKDPADDKMLECAIEAGADVIVSGDKHLLELMNYRGIRIIKPSDLIKIL
jgi:putative PIN family toxin of toxin-antitoxin system